MKLSPDSLKSPPWHGIRSGQGKALVSSSAILEILVPAVVILLLVAAKAQVMAGVAAGIAALVIVVRHTSSGGRRAIDRALGVFAHWVGQIVATILLAPVFYVGMTLVRLLSRLTGNDPLHLRGKENPTFWLPSDGEKRRLRHVKSMFCTERLVHGRMSLIPMAVIGLLLLAFAEVGLRIYGLRDAVLYVQDYDVGYYPKPNQRVRHPGRIIKINNHSMRSPEVTETKLPGHFRILMLGDSTLAGTRVSNGELYSSLLENKLNAAAGARVFEVMNMGVNAWGPHHELGFVKKFGIFQADLAIICGPVGNCYRPRYGMERLPFLPASHPPRLALEHVAYQLLWRYREKMLGAPPFTQGGAVDIVSAKGVEAYGELAEYLQQHGAEVLVEMLPVSEVTLGLSSDSPQDPLFDKVAERVGRTGVIANLAGPIFRGAGPVKKIYHDGVHFERLGHQLYADYLFERVRHHSGKIKEALDQS